MPSFVATVISVYLDSLKAETLLAFALSNLTLICMLFWLIKFCSQVKLLFLQPIQITAQFHLIIYCHIETSSWWDFFFIWHQVANMMFMQKRSSCWSSPHLQVGHTRVPPTTRTILRALGTFNFELGSQLQLAATSVGCTIPHVWVRFQCDQVTIVLVIKDGGRIRVRAWGWGHTIDVAWEHRG